MIFFFSGTGNTRWVAGKLAEVIQEPLVNIAEEMKKGPQTYSLHDEERLGFCFPTHGWQPPRIVRQFIRQSTFSFQRSAQCNVSHPYCYAVTTCGDNMGETMTILNKELRAKGLEAETQFSVIMPESYVCLPFMYTDTEERVEEKVENAQRQIQHIARIIKDRKRGIVELERGATPRLYSYVIGAYFNKKMITDSKFTVDTNMCIQCGLCQRVCSVDNIVGTPPRWLHNDSCTMCLACYHHCPVHAINYGNITRKRGQYYMKMKDER